MQYTDQDIRDHFDSDDMRADADEMAAYQASRMKDGPSTANPWPLDRSAASGLPLYSFLRRRGE